MGSLLLQLGISPTWIFSFLFFNFPNIFILIIYELTVGSQNPLWVPIESPLSTIFKSLYPMINSIKFNLVMKLTN